MTPAQKQFGGVERLRITIDLETIGCHEYDVISPEQYRTRIERELRRIVGDFLHVRFKIQVTQP